MVPSISLVAHSTLGMYSYDLPAWCSQDFPALNWEVLRVTCTRASMVGTWQRKLPVGAAIEVVAADAHTSVACIASPS